VKTRFDALSIESHEPSAATEDDVRAVQIQVKHSARVEVIVYHETLIRELAGNGASNPDDLALGSIGRGASEPDDTFRREIEPRGSVNDCAESEGQSLGGSGAPREEGVERCAAYRGGNELMLTCRPQPPGPDERDR
jgi:hypothetical protein